MSVTHTVGGVDPARGKRHEPDEPSEYALLLAIVIAAVVGGIVASWYMLG